MSPHLLNGSSNGTKYFFQREFEVISKIMITKYSDFSNKWWLWIGSTARAWIFLNLQGLVMQKSIYSLVQAGRVWEWRELGELKYEWVSVGFWYSALSISIFFSLSLQALTTLSSLPQWDLQEGCWCAYASANYILCWGPLMDWNLVVRSWW